MQKSLLISALSITLLILGCSPGHERSADSMVTADSTSSMYVSSSAAVENSKDSSRKFIRTAELKFKVKNVVKSTYNIEDITARQGGFVTYTNLTSNIDNVTTTAISADSSLETTYFTSTNSITIRVPNTRLDTTLKEIAKNIDYLDYRTIKADDVALQILSNNLTQKRAGRNGARLTNAIDNRGKKLYETTAAEELLLSKQEQADNAKIANLSLLDQVNFSTINLIIYQRQSIKRELVSNDKNIDAYEPGFGSKLIESILFGWNILATFILFLVSMWGILLFALIAYILIVIIRKKLRKKPFAEN
jgi:hypothetical protein